MSFTFKHQIAQAAEFESFRPDLSRAIRGTTAVMIPLILQAMGYLPAEAVYDAFAAQSVAIVDVRGAYSLRVMLLLSMTAVLAGSAGLGGLVAPHLGWAIVAMAFISLCSGLWRHLSSDYGPALGVFSTLLFAVAVAGHGGPAIAERHALATFAGGLWGLGLQVILWPFAPQHPLRSVVADSWVAVAGLFDALAPTGREEAAQRHLRVAEAEATLRVTLEKTYASLETARTGRRAELVRRLEDLNKVAGRLSSRVGAFNTALEALMERPDFNRIAPSFLPVLTALANTSRTVALAVVSRQPGHLETFQLRVVRLINLLRVLESRIAARTGLSEESAHLVEILRQIQEVLPVVGAALRATIDRAHERSAFSVELLDLNTWTIRPLAAALNLSTRVDPALVRYTFRIAVLTTAGVVAFKLLKLPHGYWLPFTLIVVLQPDYGATRLRAAQRMLGTLVGSAVASAILWLALPVPVLLAAATATTFVSVYLLKRNYGFAVVFITLFVVLLTEAGGKITWAFTLERLAITTAGGLLALIAALVFWPVWERDRFPPILARAFRANAAYLRILIERVAKGLPYDDPAVRAKRAAESANSEVFSSLQRMNGDPKSRRDRIERAAALANGNQRLTRALNVLTLHLEKDQSLTEPLLADFSQKAEAALEALAVAAEKGDDAREALDPLRTALDTLHAPDESAEDSGPGAQRRSWIIAQLARAGTELSAMLLA